jgi:preprotein translocase subunit YajC
MQQTTGWLMAAGGAASMMPLVTMFMVFMVIYFLILRPQAKRQKQREAMLKQATKGDRIVTSSGIYGSIVGTRGDDVIIVKIADNVTVEMARPAVASIVKASTDEKAVSS